MTSILYWMARVKRKSLSSLPDIPVHEGVKGPYVRRGIMQSAVEPPSTSLGRYARSARASAHSAARLAKSHWAILRSARDLSRLSPEQLDELARANRELGRVCTVAMSACEMANGTCPDQNGFRAEFRLLDFALATIDEARDLIAHALESPQRLGRGSAAARL